MFGKGVPAGVSPRGVSRALTRTLASAIATLALVASGLVFQAGVDVPGAWAAVSQSNLVLSYDASNTASYPGSGTSITDLSGGGHTGTLSGTTLPTYSSGAFTFAGGSNGASYVNVGGNLSGFNTGITVSVEGNLATVDNYERFVDFGDLAANSSGLYGNGGNGFLVGRFYNTGEVMIEMFNNGVSAGQCRSSGAGADNSYARWTFTVSSTGLCKIYKNGVALSTNNNGGTNSSTGTQITAPSSATLSYNYIGRSHWTADSELAGGIKWIKVYKTELSQADITDETTGTATFNANGGSGSMSAQSSTMAATLTSNAFSRTGYTFAGWNTAANGSGYSYANGATYSFNDDVTMYAQWTLNAPSYTAVPTISGTAQVGQTLTASAGTWVSGTIPTYGYQWQTSSDNSSWTSISGATSSSYTLSSTDAGQYIRVYQTATNATATTTAPSAATSMVLSSGSVNGGSGSANSVGSMFTVPAGTTVYNVTLTSSNLAGRFSLGTTSGLTWVEGYSTTASYMPTSISGSGSIFSFRGTGDAINTALATLNYTSSNVQIDVLKINYAAGSTTATDVSNYIPIYDNGTLTYHYYSYTANTGTAGSYRASANTTVSNKTYGGLTSPNNWYLVTPRYSVENARVLAILPGGVDGAWTSGTAASGGLWKWPAGTDGFASDVTYSSGSTAQNSMFTYWGPSQPNVSAGWMGYWNQATGTQIWATGTSSNSYATSILAETYSTTPISATTTAQTYRTVTAPGAPTSLAATATSGTATTLSWTAPSSAGTDALTDYTVQWSTSSTFASKVTTVSRTASTTASQVITDLTANSTIYFRVAAVSSVTGAWSSTLTYVVPNADAPSVTARAAGWVSSADAAVALSWTAPTTYNSATISSYVVERSTDQSTWTSVGSTSALSMVATGLTENTLYYFRVRAVLSSGTGANSASASATTRTATTTLTVVASGGGTAGTDYGVSNGLIVPLTSTSVSVNAADLATVLANNPRVWLAADTVNISSAVSWSTDSQLTIGSRLASRVAVNADLSASGANAGLVISPAACAFSSAGTYTGCYSLDVKSGANITLTGTTPTLSIGGLDYKVVNTASALTTFGATAANASAKFAITDTIDLSGTTWQRSNWSSTPMFFGTAGSTFTSFTGVMDGLGNTIQNFKLVATAYDNGFFFQVNGATLRNVGFTNIDFSTSPYSSTSYITLGALVGLPYGSTTIDQVWSTGAINASGTFRSLGVGGIAGYANSGTLNITRSWSSVAINVSNHSLASAAVGGIFGGTSSGNDGLGYAHQGLGGGGVAAANVTIEQAYTTGPITVQAASGWNGVGGIMGLNWTGNYSTTVLRDVFAWGKFTASSNHAGIIGLAGPGTFTSTTSIIRGYTAYSTCINSGSGTLAAGSSCTPSQTPGATLSGTNVAAWGSTTGTSLVNLAAPVIPLYVVPYLRTGNTSFTDGSYGAVGYKVVDANGNDLTSTLGGTGYPTVSGTVSWDTITSSTAVGSYSVKYSSGLSLSGTAASSYSLNPATTATSIQLTSATVASPPTGVTVTGSGQTTAVVGWTAAAQSGATAVTNYRIWYSTSNAISGATTALTGSVNTWAQLSGLTSGTTYYVWVQPMGAAWVGNVSAVASGATKSAATALTVSSSASSNLVTAGGAVALSGSNTSGNISVTDLQTLLATGSVILAADTVTVSNAVTWSTDSILTLGNTSSSTVALNADLTATGTNAGLKIAPDACVAGASTGCYSIDTKNSANVTLSGTSSTLSIAGNAYTLIRTEADIATHSTAGRTGWWFALANPITLATAYTSSPFNFTYTGKFDGLGNTLSNMTISPTMTGNYGLFSSLGGATMRNLGLLNVNISVSANSVDLRIGSIAGNGSTSGTNTISQVWSTGFITQSGTSGVRAEIGGMVGGATGDTSTLSIFRSWTSVTMKSLATTTSIGLGGIIGSNVSAFEKWDGTGSNLSITQTYTTGDLSFAMTTGWRGIGGIIGAAGGRSLTIANAFSWGLVSGASSANGIVGAATSTISVSNVYSTQSTIGVACSGVCQASVAPGAAVSGLSSDPWSTTNGASLTSLPAPTKTLYVQVTAPTDGSYGTLGYQIVDSTGSVQSSSTLASLNLSVSGTPTYTINATATKATYNVNYVTGLILAGTSSGVYSLSAWINTTSVTISKYNQTVTWAPTAAIAFGSGTATPSALASSSISTTFSYTVTSAGATGCVVNASTGVLTYTAAGTCAVTVTAAASGDYLASTATVSFVIGAPAASITVVASGGGTLGTDFFVGDGALYGAAGANLSVNAADVASALASGTLTLAAGTVTINAPITWSASNVLKLGLSTASTVSVNADLTAAGASAGLVIAPATYALAVNTGANIILSGASSTLSIGGTAYSLVRTTSDFSSITNATSQRWALANPVSYSSAVTAAPINVAFAGNFDGLGNSVNNLNITMSAGNTNYGLFTSTTGGTIRNLGVTNLNYLLAAPSANYGSLVGGVVGVVNSGTVTIDQVWTTGSIRTSGSNSFYGLALGGIVGDALGGTANISRSWSSVGINASATTVTNLLEGGILGGNVAGFAQAATDGGASVSLSQVYSTGTIVATAAAPSWWGVGGLIGLTWATGVMVSVADSFSWVTITSSSPNWGGIIGNSSGATPTVSNVYTSLAYCISYNNTVAVPSGCKVSVAAGADSTLTGSNWVSGSTLANVQSPLIPLYVQAMFTNSTGSVSDLWYQILDSSGAVVTLSSLNLSLTGTIVYSPSSMPVSGTAYSVGYDSGLTLSGATASRYSLSNWVSPTSVTISRNVATLSWSPATAFTRLQTGTTLAAPTSNSSATPTYSIAAAGGTGCTITSGRVLSFTAAGTCQVKVDYAQVTSYTAASQTVSIVISNAAPLAPTAVTVVGGTASGQLDVSWTAPSTAATGGTIASYTVEYSTDQTNWTEVTGLTGTSTTITGLTNDTPYYVRVKAINTESMVGAWGVPGGAVKPYWKPTNSVAPTGPTAAVGGIAVSVSNDGTWSANGNTISSTTYQWQISSDGTNWSNITTNGTGQSYVPLASQAGQYLRVQVTKSNSAGATTVATGASTAIQSGLAAAPTLGSIARGNTTLTANWTAPSTLNGGTISGYKVQYRAGTSGAWTTASSAVASSASSYTITGLSNGTGYTVQVLALTAAGDGATVASTSTATPATGPSNTVLPLITGTPARAVALTASGGTWSDGGDAVTLTTYQWQTSTDGLTGWTDITGATAASYTPVVGDVGNYLRVVVTVANTVSSASAESLATTAVETGIAGVASGLTATASNGQLVFSWTAPATLNGGVVSDYELNYKKSTDSSWTSVTVGSTAISKTVTGLVNATSYDWNVAAITAAGTGPVASYSANLASTPFTTPSNSALPTLSGVFAVARTLSATDGSWTDNGRTSTLSYQWQSAATLTGSYTNIGANDTASTYTPVAADAGRFIKVVVTATNAAGSTSATSAATTVVQSGLAAAPTGLSAVLAASPSLHIALNWTAPSALNGASALTGYRVSYRVHGSTGAWTVASNSIADSATGYDVTGLTTGTSYDFTVEAGTAAGWGAVATASNVLFGGAPANTVSPVVSGSLGNGETLSVTDGSWNDNGVSISGISYQWQRWNAGTSAWDDISNETYNSYTITLADVGTDVRVVVEASNSVGSTDVATAGATVGSAIAAAPTLSATDGNGQIALSWTAPSTLNGGVLRGYVVEINSGSGWAQVGTQLATNVTSKTITGLSNAASYDVRVRAVTTLAGTNATLTGRIPYTVPSNTVAPSLSGSVAAGATVNAVDGTWLGNGRAISSTSYVWQSKAVGASSWSVITGATSSSYLVDAALQTAELRVVVTRSNAAGATTVESAGSTVIAGVPVVSAGATLGGTATVGYALNGTDASFVANDSAGVSVSQRWEVSSDGSSGWTAITGATAVSFTPTSAESGKYVRFVSIGANSLNSTESASSASAQIASGIADAPSTVTATPGDTSISVSWSAVTGSALNGSTRASYRVEWSSNGQTWVGTNVTGTSATIASLVNNTTYTVRVAAVSSVAVTGAFATSSQTVPFGAPILTTAQTLSGAEARGYQLSSTSGVWDANGRSITATSTKWQRLTSGGSWTDISGGTGTSYTLGASDVGALVRSVVTVTNAFGSTSSESLPTGVIGSAAAAAPSNLVITPGDGQLALSWTAPTSLDGGTIVDYEVLYSTDQNTWNTFSHSASTSTSATITGLSNAANYWLSVAAITTVTGAPVLSTSAAVPYGLPINTAVPTVSGSVRIGDTLTAAPGTWNGNGRTISQTDYQWQWYSSVDQNWHDLSGATAQQYVPTGVFGKALRVKVTDHNLAGSTDAYSLATAAVAIGTPGAPTGLSIAPGDLSLTASWTAPTYLADGSITDYTVEINDGSGWTAVTRTASATASQTVTGLTEGTVYQLRVRTETGLSSAWSGVASFTAVAKPSLSTAPVLSGTPLHGSTLSVTDGLWNAHGSSITGVSYQWQISTDGTTWNNVSAISSTVTAVNLRYYRVIVTASNAAGSTSTTTAATLWIVTSAPAAPSGLTVTEQDQQLAVSWTAPTGAALGGGTVSDYVVEYSTDGSTWLPVSRTASTTASQTIAGLTNGTDYQVRVQAITSIPGAWLNSTGTYRPYGAPIAVGGAAPITGTVRYDSTVYANPGSWDWNGAVSGPISYQWQINTGSGWSDIVGETGSSYHITGNVDGLLRVNITATNGAGQHSTVPSAVTAGIQAANPTMPQNFVATPGDGQIALSWAAPSSLGGTALVSYVVQISTDGTTYNSVSRSNVLATTETLTGLSNNTPYYVRVRAMTRNTGAWANSASTVVPYGLPINTVLPAISGAAEYESTLLASSGNWNENGRSATLSYQWQAQVGGTWTNIPGATASSYQVGLYVGSAIRVQVTSTNLAGATTENSLATSAVIAQPAGAPTGLSATLADHSIQLSWTAPNYIGGSAIADYRVQIRTTGGSWTTVSRTASTATSQTITNLTNGTSYEVQVQALTTVDGNLTTLGSLVPRATPINTALPAITLQSGASAPQYDFAVSTDLGSWNSNGANLNNQTIQWQVKLGGTWTNIPGATGASYTVADYVGSQLRATVTASNVAGSTVAYSAATAAVVANPAAAPSNVSLVPGDQSIVVSWTAPTYLGGDVIVDYLVETSTGGSWTPFTHTASTATTQTVTGLTNGTTVQVRVSAVTSANGVASASVSSVPRSNPISTALPTLSWQTPIGSTTAAPQVGRTISASNGSWNANGAAISGYGYQWQLNTGSGWVSISGEIGASYLVTGNVGGQLRVIVTASNVAGGTSATSTSSPVIISGPATPPRNVQVTEVDHGLQLSWTAPLISGGAAITDYEVEYTTDGNTWVPVSHTASNATTQSISSLSNAVATTVRVRAMNGVNGEWVITDPATPRGLPISQTAPGVTGSALFGATLTAGPGVWNSNGADIDSFTFQWQSSRDGVAWSTVPGATGSSYQVGLFVGSKLRVQVTATNEAGSTIASSQPTATVSAIPAATPQLTSQSVGNAQMTLGWTPPIHSGGVELSGYTLEYSTDQANWTSLSYDANTTSATITGLRNGSNYYARVRAETDRAGDWSSVAGPFAPVAPPVVAAPSATPNYDFLRQLVMPVAPTGTVLTSLTGPSAVTVRSDGRIELTPTQSVALRDGQPVTAAVALTDSGLSVQTDTVSIGLSFATAATTEASASGTSVLQQGQTAQLTGTGFAEGTPVVGWIQSDPIKIGEATVADGVVTGEFTIPSDIEPGQHTIQVNGIDAQGSVVSIIYGVEVQATPDVVETVGAGALAEPGSLTASWIWVLGAIFLLLIILTAIILIRRRQQSN